MSLIIFLLLEKVKEKFKKTMCELMQMVFLIWRIIKNLPYRRFQAFILMFI